MTSFHEQLGKNLGREKKEDLTEIVFILDKSSSMHKIKSDVIGGFNAFLEGQKKVKGRANFTLILFSHTAETVIKGVDINEVEELTDETYSPDGMTALTDAIGLGIDGLDARFNKYNEYADNVVFAIMTDGEENSSREYNIEGVKSKISKLKEEKNYQFIFLGANIDAVTTAKGYGIGSDTVGQFSATGDGGSKSLRSASAMTTSYRDSGTMRSYEEVKSDNSINTKDIYDKLSTSRKQDIERKLAKKLVDKLNSTNDSKKI